MLALLLVSAGLGSAVGVRAQAPQVVSSTPANGATGVGATDPLVIVFDRDMDVNVGVFASPSPGLVGNLLLEPATLASQMFGSWEDDQRTLTITPLLSIPLDITVNWTLNPPGVLSFLQIKSADGVPLATVSGSYSTGGGGPALGLVTPSDNEENVDTNVTVIFRFTQPMKKIALPGGTPPAIVWTGTGLDTSKFRYTWGADGRTLGVEYLGGFPLKTRVDWALNPVGAPVIFESATGKPLVTGTYQGGFKTTATPQCDDGPLNPTWGSYGMTKRSEFLQTSSADPVEEIQSDESPAPDVFSVVIQSPAFGPAITAGSVELPNGTRTNLNNFGFVSFYDVLDSEAALEAAYPPGTYTVRFTQTGLPEWVVPMTMNAADVPPVPKVVNYDAAQSVAAAEDFTLRWNAFSNATTNDLISLFLYNEEDEVVFQAPEFCIPRRLVATDTSIVIPSETLQPNRTYNAQLLFGKFFYSSTNAVPEMSGYGFRIRTTRFTVKTGTGGTPGEPPVLSGARVLASGKTAFDLIGVAGRTYGIQRADSVDAASWPEVGTVVANGSGVAVYEDSQVLGAAPRFYRAVSK